MVPLTTIQASNALIPSTLPHNLVAVFVGATNGVGETTVRQFAKYTAGLQPRVYIVGRSEEAGERIAGECRALNTKTKTNTDTNTDYAGTKGDFIFLKRETSLMRNVDALCEELKGREKVINLLFLSVGTLQIGMKTEEGIHYPTALTILARNRIISNLLSSIRRASDSSLCRVVSTFGATMEGPISLDDFEGWHLSRPRYYGHEASITTLALEAHCKTAPEVSFVHNFPGAVESGIARGQIGWLMRTLKTIFAVLGSWVHIPLEEAGDRHLFLCTSARFPSSSTMGTSSDEGQAAAAEGVPLVEGLTRAKGTDGKEGSGVYSIDANGESLGPKVEKLLARMRDEGMVEQVWDHIESSINTALASGQKG